MEHPLYIILLNACQTLPDKGGIATYTHELAHHLGKKGHIPSVLTYPSSNSSLFPPRHYQVRRLPSFDVSRLVQSGGSRGALLTRLPPKVLGMARDIARVTRGMPRKGQRRVLWAVTWWPEGLAAWLASRMLRIPYVVTAHGYEAIVSPHARRHFLYRGVMNRASRVFAVSAHTAGHLRRCGVSARGLRVVHNGIRLEPFVLDHSERPLVEQTRNRYSLQGRFVLLTVARLVPRKGHLAVLEALAGLRGRLPGLCYIIAGEGPMMEELREAVKGLCLQDSVRFCGEISDKEKVSLLHACDVFVMPNRDIQRPDGVFDTEGFGIVFLEASACGKPVIAGRAGGAPEAVVDGHTGILVDPSNPGELEEAVFRLYADRDMALRLGLEGKRRVEREFTWDRLVDQYLNELTVVQSRS